MNILIPIISSLCFWLGGRDQIPWLPWNQKLNRWCMGIPIAVLTGNYWLVLTYFLATNVSGYGENHPFRKWFGREGAWLVYGGIFGLASIPYLGWVAIVQCGANMGLFWLLMKWSNDGIGQHKLQHQFVEFLFGFIGTLGYLWTS